MSAELPLDPRQLICIPLEMMLSSYIKDLSHVPADKLSVSPMGVARSAKDFTVEVIGFNMLVAHTIAGTQPDDSGKPEYETFEDLKAGLEASVKQLVAAVQASTDADLGTMAAAPWGAQMPKFQLANMPAYHMMYHDGQINYIQALFGDGESHWD